MFAWRPGAFLRYRNSRRPSIRDAQEGPVSPSSSSFPRRGTTPLPRAMAHPDSWRAENGRRIREGTRHRRRCAQPCGSTARPSTISASAPRSKMAGETRIFEWRVPPPSITSFLRMMRESTQSGRSAGSPSGVTPPIVIPVMRSVSSADAKDTRREPIRLRTHPVHVEPGMRKERASRETLASRLALHDDGVDGVLGGIAVVFAEAHGVRELRIAGHQPRSRAPIGRAISRSCLQRWRRSLRQEERAGGGV